MNKFFYEFCKIIIKPFIKIIFPYEVKGIENAKSFKDSGYVLCSNHLSNVDPVFLILINPTPINFMAKQELFKSKIVSFFLKMLGVFPVNRGKGDKRALEYAIKIPSKKEVLGIFIEGTRSKTGEFLRPRSGATLIASKSNSDVLPVCITGGGQNGKIKAFKKTTIIYGKKIEGSCLNFENRLQLKQSTEMIMGSIKKLRINRGN